MNILTNVLALIVVLSVLVVVHEFGHFAVAKFFGFPVEVFSVGFGKRLFGRKWRGTDYRVSAIPLGGYVRVIGLGPDESTVTEGTSREAPPVGKRWQRALVLLAGPVMNLALAFFLHATVFAVGTRVPAYELESPVVRVVEADSPGAEAGFQPGDRIVAINGRATPRWRDVALHLRDERPRAPRRRGRPRRQDRHPPGDAQAEHEVRPRVRGAPAGFRRRTSAPRSPRSSAARLRRARA